MSDGGMELLGALMTRSASDLAWTRDRIEEGLRDEVKRLRTLVLDMAEVFDNATVMDRNSEQAWRSIQHRVGSVEDAVMREESAS